MNSVSRPPAVDSQKLGSLEVSKGLTLVFARPAAGVGRWPLDGLARWVGEFFKQRLEKVARQALNSSFQFVNDSGRHTQGRAGLVFAESMARTPVSQLFGQTSHINLSPLLGPQSWTLRNQASSDQAIAPLISDLLE
jgi:hypothetical protein